MEDKMDIEKLDTDIKEPVGDVTKQRKGFGSGICIGALGAVCFLLIVSFLAMNSGKVSLVMNASVDKEDDTEKVLDTATVSKLEQLIGQMDLYYYEKPDTDKLQEGLCAGLLEGLGDPYSVYYNKDQYKDMLTQVNGNFYGIGAGLGQDKETMQVTITKIYEDTPADKAGLKVGDIITKVDDIDATSMELSELVQHIRGEEGSTVHLKIVRAGETDYLEYDIERAKVNEQTVTGQMLQDGIGYIAVSEFAEDTANQFEKTIADLESQGMRAMIVDLRNNGGGQITAVSQMLDDLLPEGVLVYTEDKYGNRQDYKSSNDTVKNYPMTVLVNGFSASASEIFAGAIRDYNYGQLIGSTTFGKGVVQKIMPLPEGDAIKLTVAKWYTPNGDNIQDTGFEPDIAVEYEYTGSPDQPFDINQDNQVAKAIEVLEGELQ